MPATLIISAMECRYVIPGWPLAALDGNVIKNSAKNQRAEHARRAGRNGRRKKATDK